MDKLNKYNQKILAIIGTTILVALVGWIVIGFGVVAYEYFDRADVNEGIQIRATALDPSDSSLLKSGQAVTIDAPIQLDTAYARFVIPIGQVNIENKKRGAGSGSSQYNKSNYKYSSYYGIFNNFVYYDHNQGFKEKVFNEKIAISHWSYLRVGEIEVLLFKGAKKDSNGDKILDGRDYQSLFAYYVSDHQLVEYGFPKSTVIELEPMSKTNLIAITVGLDKDGDLQYESVNEPQEIVTLDVKSRKTKKLVSKKMKADIQRKID